VGLEVGARIADRYVIVALLGSGGMGSVYLARDEQSGDEVALKLLHDSAVDDVAVRRLRREARATQTLDPKRVARVVDSGVAGDGSLFLAMEFVRGTTLRELALRGRLPRAEALRIVREMAVTLDDAHRAGLVHRDVKPENVLVADDGRVVLLDFGIVKQLDPKTEPWSASTQVTREGTLVGTVAYLSPEQALGEEVGPASDQFALALVAFELLTGRAPWVTAEATHHLANLIGTAPPPASTIETSLPSAIDDALAGALAKKPSERFASTLAFADALDAAMRGEPITSPAARTLEEVVTKGHARAIPSRARAIALIAAPLLAAIAFFALREARPTRTRAVAPAPPANVLGAPDATLACPIFEARGADSVAGWLGAAAASMTCRRAAWLMGGRDERVLVPAALLDVPLDPVEHLADPYTPPEQRARTLEIARRRAAAYLDGRVARANDRWTIALALRSADGSEISKVESAPAAQVGVAIVDATERLWSTPPLARATIDPHVATWTGFPDLEIGLAFVDLTIAGDHGASRCATIRRRARDLSSCTLESLWNACKQVAGESDEWKEVLRDFDPHACEIDESSAVALASSVSALANSHRSFDAARLAPALDAYRASEPSRVGRALLAYASGDAWDMAKDPDRRRAAVAASIREDPVRPDAWFFFAMLARQAGDKAFGATAAAWLPSEPTFFRFANAHRREDLPERLRDTELSYMLEPTSERALYWGFALAESGHFAEARNLASVALGPDSEGAQYILAHTELAEAKLARGLARMRKGLQNRVQFTDAVPLARLLGAQSDVGEDWSATIAASTDAQVKEAFYTPHGALLCVNARSDHARACIARARRVLERPHDYWGEPGELLLRGAELYVAGDVRGAVAAWRPLVNGPSPYMLALLPIDAFERAGAADLAARIDDRAMEYAIFAGVSEAAPREAKRALARGDRQRAKELAQSVIRAWEVADVSVPAVAEMRALLAAIDR
jgi:predicted Ser/Thr protein kinase